jgi:Flp pilus assembly protein TadG
MTGLRILRHREWPHLSKCTRRAAAGLVNLFADTLCADERLAGERFADERGSALLEFAITLPLLVVFVVGIYDFSGAFDQKQKVEQAAQEGAILAGALPTSDIQSSNPASLQAVVTAVINSLGASGVLPNAPCGPYTVPPPTSLSWTYTVSGCNSAYPSDNLVITINRGWVSIASTPAVAGTVVTVQYPYHWRFGSVIQLLFPGPNGYLAPTQVTESSTVHNQM